MDPRWSMRCDMLEKMRQCFKSDLKTEQSGGNKHRTVFDSSVLNVAKHLINLPSFLAYLAMLTTAQPVYWVQSLDY
jgi:hypothetical protein